MLLTVLNAHVIENETLKWRNGNKNPFLFIKRDKQIIKIKFTTTKQ